MFKSIITFCIIIIIIPSLYSREWEKGIKAFSLGMTVEEVEGVLKSYLPAFKPADNKFSENSYFFPIYQKFDYPMYINNENLTIQHNSFSGCNYVQGQVQLKKVFGYQIGVTQWKDSSIVSGITAVELKTIKKLNKIDSSTFEKKYLKNILNEEDKKFFISVFTKEGTHYFRSKFLNEKQLKRLSQLIKVIDYNSQLYYNYKYFPVYKLNRILKLAEFSFYENRLFQIAYQVQFDNKNDKMLFDKHLENTYDKVFKDRKFIGYRKNEKFTLKKEVINPKKHIYLLIYKDLSLSSQFNEYMKQCKDKVKNTINNQQNSELKQF